MQATVLKRGAVEGLHQSIFPAGRHLHHGGGPVQVDTAHLLATDASGRDRKWRSSPLLRRRGSDSRWSNGMRHKRSQYNEPGAVQANGQPMAPRLIMAGTGEWSRQRQESNKFTLWVAACGLAEFFSPGRTRGKAHGRRSVRPTRLCRGPWHRQSYTRRRCCRLPGRSG